MPPLANAKRERFCQEYLIDLNGTKAAERSKYSKHTANEQGSRLLANVNVQQRIAELKAERAARTQVDQDRVIEEIKILAFSDFRDYGETVKEFGPNRLRLKTFAEIEEGKTRAIQSIKETIGEKSVQLHFKLHGKLPALELLGKHIGMFVERMALTGEDGGPIQIQYVLAKPKKRKRGGDGKGNQETKIEVPAGSPGSQGEEGK